MIIEGGRQVKCPLLLCTTADRMQATNVADSAVNAKRRVYKSLESVF